MEKYCNTFIENNFDDNLSIEERNELVCEKLKSTYIDLLAIRIVNRVNNQKEVQK
jgi:hypothetical protein